MKFLFYYWNEQRNCIRKSGSAGWIWISTRLTMCMVLSLQLIAIIMNMTLIFWALAKLTCYRSNANRYSFEHCATTHSLTGNAIPMTWKKVSCHVQHQISINLRNSINLIRWTNEHTTTLECKDLVAEDVLTCAAHCTQ